MPIGAESGVGKTPPKGKKQRINPSSTQSESDQKDEPPPGTFYVFDL